jgi:hypothetical protein
LIAIGAATSPIWGTVLWVLWQGLIRPRLIPRAEIDALAAAMLARHGLKAEEAAFAEEELAWRHFRALLSRENGGGSGSGLRKKMRTTRHRVVLD